MCDFTEMTPYIAELRTMQRIVEDVMSRTECVPDCPQPDYPIRERAYTQEQLRALAHPSPSPASPSRDALQALPLCHVGAGDLSIHGESA